jgi:hypothetical protein
MKISPYTIYLEMQPDALLVRQNFIICKKWVLHIWTSPVVNISSSKYCLIILDDFLYYSWTFTLCLKSDTLLTITQFFSFVTTQFGRKIKSVQCNNGCEFDNSLRKFFLAHGVHLGYPAHTPPLKMVKPCVCCTPPITLFAVYYFKLPCHHNIR